MSTPNQVEFLRHELLDRTNNLLSQVDQQLCEHMSLNNDSQAFSQEQLAVIRGYTERAARALSGLYQYIGGIHL